MNYRVYTRINIAIALIITAIVAWIGFDTVTLHIHGWNSPFADFFFKNYTIWAEWPVIVVGILLLLKVEWRKGLWYSLIFAVEGLIINILKQGLNRPRPIEKFGYLVRHIDGEVLSHTKGFPSGHTSAAFFATGMILIALSHYNLKKYWSYIIIATAFLIGYSRVYLGQHSIEDVIAGCILANIFLYFAGITAPWFINKTSSDPHV